MGSGLNQLLIVTGVAIEEGEGEGAECVDG